MSGFAASDFAPVVTGAAVYFDQLNASGGVDGRKIVYSPQHRRRHHAERRTRPGPSSWCRTRSSRWWGWGRRSSPGPSILQQHAVPTFGLQENTNAQWAGPTMFGATGSYSDFTAPMPQVAYVAERNHDTRAAVLAYNVAQSSDGCISVIAALRKYHIDTPIIDTSIPYGAATLDADVSRMQQQGVDFVATCMDATGNIKLSQTLQQHGMGSATQYWLDGYDQQTLDDNAAAMDGAYFFLQQTPFEATALDPRPLPGHGRLQRRPAAVRPGEHPVEHAGPGRLGERRPLHRRAAGHRHRRDPHPPGAAPSTPSPPSPPTGSSPRSTGGWPTPASAVSTATTFVQARKGPSSPSTGPPPSFYSCFGPRPTASGGVDVLPLQPGVPGG